MIRSETITYNGPGGPFKGHFCIDDQYTTPRPGVLVAHAFSGQSGFERARAEKLAEMGYAAMAIDMYGDGYLATEREEAKKLMNALNADRQLLSERINSAHQALKDLPLVDPSRTAGIGFCFGGKCMLDLARSGADICGVASFHGIFDPPAHADNSPISSKVLVLHGWDDPLATPAQTVELTEELTRRQADWQLVAYGHTGHAFTNPKANMPEKGLLYNELVDGRSWLAMENFLAEVLQ